MKLSNIKVQKALWGDCLFKIMSQMDPVIFHKVIDIIDNQILSHSWEKIKQQIKETKPKELV
jgi:hypothetical protein